MIGADDFRPSTSPQWAPPCDPQTLSPSSGIGAIFNYLHAGKPFEEWFAMDEPEDAGRRALIFPADADPARWHNIDDFLTDLERAVDLETWLAMPSPDGRNTDA